MRTLLNIIWLVFGGFWLALGYFLAGVVCCLLIVTIPLGIASFRIASYTL
ncbi:MAG: YccF domain-containing protein, partial [Actinomycetes bacterium]